MTEFAYTAPALGSLNVIRVERGARLDESPLRKTISSYLNAFSDVPLTTFVTANADPLMLEITEHIQLALKHPQALIKADVPMAKSEVLLKVRSSRWTGDVYLSPELLGIKRLGVICTIDYHWIFGFRGASAATFEMYRSTISTKPWRREKMIFELSGRLPADVSVGLLEGNSCRFLLFSSSPILLDAMAIRMMGIPLDAIPLFAQLKEKYSYYDEIQKIPIPDGFRAKPIPLSKKVAFWILIIFFAVVTWSEMVITMAQRSISNLYRIPSFIRKRIARIS